MEFEIGVVLFTFGLWLGQFVSNRKWASNANDYRRMEWKGRLYKVNYDEE